MSSVEPRIIDLKEREGRPLPRNELFDHFGRSLVLPETRAIPAVELRELISGTEVEVKAKGLVGYLPLTSDIVLNLRPKFPLSNLWFMLNEADESYDRILPVIRSYEQTGTNAPHQFLVRGFCHYLRNILAVGVSKGYYQKPFRGYFQPKVQFGETLSRFLARGDSINVSSHVFAFSADLPANAVLRSACLDFIRLVSREQNWDVERHLILEALNALAMVQARRMLPGEESLSSTVPAWLRDDYHGALLIYSVLLGHTQIGFGYDAQGAEMPSFLFSLDDIFESFVRNILRKGLRSTGISVTDGNKRRHQGSLFSDTRRHPIKPDAIIRLKNEILALGEVKYKHRIDENDRYQLISHVVASGSPIGFWVSPAPSEENVGMSYVGSIATGAKFYHYKLNVSSDLDAATSEMVKAVAKLITT